MTLRCTLHVTANGNRFMTDLAGLFAAALDDVGVPSRVALDEVPVGDDGVVDVIVAPHEWFEVGPQLSAEDAYTVAATSVLLGTEQPETPWFDLALPRRRMARASLDINRRAVAALLAEGIPTTYAPLGYHPTIDAWGGDPDAPRPIDVAFLGGATPRRTATLGSMASMLWHRSTKLLLHDPSTPMSDEGADFVTGRARAELLASTSVLVNIHRAEEPYFEWVRAIEALANGAVLVSETSTDFEPLAAFEHLVVAAVDDLAAHVTALLHDEPLRRSIAGDAYDFVRSELDLRALVREIVPVLEACAWCGPPRPTPEILPRRVLAARSHEPPPDDLSRVKAATKRLILGQQQLTRQLEDADARRRGVDPDAVQERSTPSWNTAAAEVTVVIPLYRYGHTIEQALDSVVASEDVAYEIVVVEDHSADGRTRETLEAYLEAHPEVPILALLRNGNRGLPAARNLGIGRARTELCFLLDADNTVRPSALRTLVDELVASGAAFAYAMIEVFGDETDLASHLPFAVSSLVRGNYIDAMSLVRKAAWEQVGGFLEGPEVYGWEDYAFWLAMAQAGLRGHLVAKPLCRYRRHAASMISVTNLDPAGPQRYLRQRFPDLPWL